MLRRFTDFQIITSFVAISILGFFLIPKLSIHLNPDQSLPSITVSYNLYNAPPEIVDMEMTSKIEGGLATITGLREIRSISSRGGGDILLKFDEKVNIDIARFDVSTIIRQLYKRFPKGSSYPRVSINKSHENSLVLMSYNVYANEAQSKIYEISQTLLLPKVSSIPGVDKTEIFGSGLWEYVIYFDVDFIKVHKITRDDLVQAIQKYYKVEMIGFTTINENSLSIKIKPKTNKLSWHIPVQNNANRIVYLDEFASIRQQEKENESIYRIDGNNAITLNIYAQNGANSLKVSELVQNKIVELEKSLPQSFSIVKSYDSGDFMRIELNKIYQRSGFTILILMGFILFLSQSIRYLIVISVSLAINLGVAFLFYYLLEIDLQLYSLAGLTISLGLIIDNIIVVVNHREKKHTSNLYLPILASTLTTVGALSVIYFLDENLRLNLIDFAKVIIVNLSSSLCVSFLFVPALFNRVNLGSKGRGENRSNNKIILKRIYEYVIIFCVKHKGLLIVFAILLFGIPTHKLPREIENNDTWYTDFYNSTIGSKWYQDTFKEYIDLCLGGTLRLFDENVYEKAIYDIKEEIKLSIVAESKLGMKKEYLDEIFVKIEVYLGQFKEIKHFSTRVLNEGKGIMEITFKDNSRASLFPPNLKTKLIRIISNYDGLNWSLRGVGDPFNSGAINLDSSTFNVICSGYNYEELNNWTNYLKEELDNHPRIANIHIREYNYWLSRKGADYNLELDKQKLIFTDIEPRRLVQELNLFSLNMYEDLYLHFDDNLVPVRFLSNQSQMFDMWHFKNTKLETISGITTLNNIATIDYLIADESIYKLNQEYLRLLQIDYTGNPKYGLRYLEEKIDELVEIVPIGFNFKPIQDKNYLKENSVNNFYLMLLVLLILYSLCAVLFESLTQPFIILSVVPITFIGVFVTFLLFDFNFDQGGVASFVLLCGLTVNASIYILNDYNTLVQKFPEVESIKLYIMAFNQKIYPIFLTIFSTIIGFIPFVIYGQNELFWFSLAVGTIGGLIFSLLSILIYLPIFTLKK